MAEVLWAFTVWLAVLYVSLSIERWYDRFIARKGVSP